jgi:hypothetical protein
MARPEGWSQGPLQRPAPGALTIYEGGVGWTPALEKQAEPGGSPSYFVGGAPMAKKLTLSQVRGSPRFAWHPLGYLLIDGELFRAVRLQPPATGGGQGVLAVRHSALRGRDHLVADDWRHAEGCPCELCAVSQDTVNEGGAGSASPDSGAPPESPADSGAPPGPVTVWVERSAQTEPSGPAATATSLAPQGRRETPERGRDRRV